MEWGLGDGVTCFNGALRRRETGKGAKATTDSKSALCTLCTYGGSRMSVIGEAGRRNLSKTDLFSDHR